MKNSYEGKDLRLPFSNPRYKSSESPSYKSVQKRALQLQLHLFRIIPQPIFSPHDEALHHLLIAGIELKQFISKQFVTKTTTKLFTKKTNHGKIKIYSL